MPADRRPPPARAAPTALVRARFEQAFADHRAGRHDAAMRGYDAVLAADPRHAAALHFSALLLAAAGRRDAATARIERSLALDDRVPDVWSNAATIYQGAGRVADAARALESALRLEPTLAAAWINLASLRLACDDAPAAETAARRALALGETHAARWTLALALEAGGRPADALDALDSLPSRDVADPAVAAFRAQCLAACGRRDAAIDTLGRALAQVDDATARIARARLLDDAGRAEAALDDYAAVLRREPANEFALSEAIWLKKRVASWAGLPALQRAFAAGVARRAAAGDASALTPFSFLSDPSTRAEQRAAATAWSRRFVAMPRSTPRAARELSTGRLRIGYLSADFHAHATAILVVGLFERHDRDRFEVFAYSSGPDDGSALRRRVVAAVDRFVDVRGWSDGRIADAIGADRIDVLVDLKGHTERATTGVVSRRPAPIAVSYLGYPGTMGAPFVDYLIGDAIVTPLAHAADYAETLVLMPHGYQPTDDRRDLPGQPPSRDALGLPGDAVVFCAFGNVWKITTDVFDAWAAVLRGVPDGVLWLLTHAGDGAVRDRLRDEAAARGIAPGRVVFADTRPHADYLALYRRADCFLDTWPYNAHTTASDALWGGCPLLTFEGDTFAGRVATSVLSAAGFVEGIAPDRAGYVARAIEWGRDRSALAAYRTRLEAHVRSSPLFDTEATTRSIEAAYTTMAAQFRAGRREAIVVPSMRA